MKNFFLIAALCAAMTATAQTKQPPKRCEGVTTKGLQCTRPASKGKAFCFQHDPTRARCNAKTKQGLPCGNPGTYNGKCYIHAAQ